MPLGAIPGHVNKFAKEQISNIYVGFQAACLHAFNPDRVRPSLSHIASLLLLSLLPQLLLQFAQTGLNGEFSFFGIQGLLFPFSAFFIFSVAAAALVRTEGSALFLLLVITSASVFVNIADSLAQYYSGFLQKNAPWINPIRGEIKSYWLGAIAAILIIRHDSTNKLAKTVAAAAIGFFTAFTFSNVILMKTVWSKPYTEEKAEEEVNYYAPVEEAAIYLQPRLLNERLDEILPAKSKQSLYLLAAAGYADQAVFKREVEYVDELFRNKFETTDHRIVLINHLSTLDSYPIASRTSIKESIKKIGQSMRSDDILFIYLTSHGSKDHQLSLRFEPLQLKDLSATDLRKYLDEAAVKWRIIVISACYSGGFIEPLSNDNTLIITAAAADKTSFGCSDESDFTYFGKAYFAEALKQTDSFTEAFKLAKESIGKREAREKQKPSDPQMFIGKDIATRLSDYERSRRSEL